MGETAGEMRPSDAANTAGHDRDRGAPPVSGEESPEELRQAIEQTRAEMGETIDAIQAQLSPEHLKEQAKEQVREATIGRAEAAVGRAQETAEKLVGHAPDSARRARSAVIEMVKRYPIPTGLLGFLLSWLVLTRLRGARGSSA